jgi:Spy/CpxP family protein refolding chaperone
MNTKTTISRFVAVSALALGISLAGPAFAGAQDQCARGTHDRPPMAAHHGGMFGDLRGIDLSADQVAQLGKLREEARKQMREQALALHDQHLALRKLVMSDAYTPAASAELIAKISAAQSEMARLHAEQGNKVYQLLTPEQRTKVQQNELTGGRSGGRGNKR